MAAAVGPLLPRSPTHEVCRKVRAVVGPIYLNSSSLLDRSAGVFDSARRLVSEHVAVEGTQGGIVDVGHQHALAQIVEHDDGHGTAQSAESPRAQPRPSARVGAKRQQTGVYGVGNSIEEGKASILESVRLYIEECRASRQPVPRAPGA